LDQSAAGSRNNPFGKSLYVETEIFEFKDGVMDDLLLTRVPVAKTGMLVRKPVADVFEAILTSQSSSTEMLFIESRASVDRKSIPFEIGGHSSINLEGERPRPAALFIGANKKPHV
jgi:hypothetical protein